MDRQFRPFPKTGSNLTARLYLLLAVIVVPAFLTYYVFIRRTAEAQRGQEIETRVHLVAGTAGSWLETARPGAAEPELRENLEQMVGEYRDQNNVQSMTVFFVGKSGDMLNVGANGGDSTARPTPEDALAFQKKEKQWVVNTVEFKRETWVSLPLKYRERYLAVAHLITTGRNSPEERTIFPSQGEFEDAAAKLAHALVSEHGGEARVELDREIIEQGFRALRVSYVDHEGRLQLLAASPVSTPSNSQLDSAVASNRAVPHTVNFERGKESLQAMWIPIARKGEFLGGIQIELAPEQFGQAAARLRRQLLLGSAAVMLIAAIGVAIFMHRSIRRPIRQLIDAMDRAAGGDLGALVEVGSGELGWVAGSFNQMLWQLKGSMDQNRRHLEQINTFNLELKKRIEAATQDIAAKNAQLEAMNEKLFILQRQMTTVEKLATLGQISATIAHELGTPLNAISGHIQLLLADHGEDPKTKERLQVIDGQLDRLASIIRNVLKTMRMPAPRFERISVNSLIEDMTDLIAPMVQKRKILVETRLHRDLPLISADSYQLEQVFMNLFTNAMDAMSSGGTLRVATSFVPAEESAKLAQEGSLPLAAGSHLRIDIADTGEGMDEETSRRLFEPFFTTKNPGSGTGLGLSICRQIVKNHDGAISVQSAKGKGTTFTIFLPVERERIVVG